MNIDVDSHFTPAEIFDKIPPEMKDAPRLVDDNHGTKKLWFPSVNTFSVLTEPTYSTRLRKDAMKEAGFDKQCLLISNGSIPEPFISVQTSAFLTNVWNEKVSDICKNDDSFIGVAQIPTIDVDAAIFQAKRAVKELGFRAIQVHGSWGGENMDSIPWLTFYREIVELGVPLWYHGTGIYANKTFNPYMPGYKQLISLPPLVGVFLGFLWQPQLMIASLIFGHVLDKFPSLRIVVTESNAGWLPSFMSWLDCIYDDQFMYRAGEFLDFFTIASNGENLKLRKKPSQYIRENFFFAINDLTEFELDIMLPVLVNQMKMESNLMIQSDYDHPEGSLDVVRRLRHFSGIGEEAKEKICGKNAADLLGIKWAPSVYSIL